MSEIRCPILVGGEREESENFELAAAAERGEWTRILSTHSNNLGGQIAWRIQFLAIPSTYDSDRPRPTQDSNVLLVLKFLFLLPSKQSATKEFSALQNLMCNLAESWVREETDFCAFRTQRWGEQRKRGIFLSAKPDME